MDTKEQPTVINIYNERPKKNGIGTAGFVLSLLGSVSRDVLVVDVADLQS